MHSAIKLVRIQINEGGGIWFLATGHDRITDIYRWSPLYINVTLFHQIGRIKQKKNVGWFALDPPNLLFYSLLHMWTVLTWWDYALLWFRVHNYLLQAIGGVP